MELGKTPIQETVRNKPRLFALTAAVIAILSLPAILPHITHPSMIYHILLHLGSLVITVFLGIVSIMAYSRTGSVRMLLMTLGFISLVCVEFLSLFAATASVGILTIPGINVELSHVFLLIMLALFGLGVLKVDK